MESLNNHSNFKQELYIFHPLLAKRQIKVIFPTLSLNFKSQEYSNF